MASVSHDGRLAATSGPDGIIRLFETETGRDAGTLGAHGTAVRGLAFSPGDQSLASSDIQGKVIVWDLARRAPRAVLRGHSGSVTSVAFSDDGQHLCTFGTDYKLMIWDVSRPPPASDIVIQQPTIVTCVAFSPDGRLLASGGPESNSRRLSIWETATGRLLHEFEGHSDRVWSVAFSPDGKELASTGIDGTLRIWDVVHGIPRMTIDSTTERKTWVSYSRDGRELISSEWGGTIRTWDRRTGTEIRAVRIGESGAWQPALSADGRYILAGLDESLVLLEYPSLKTVRRFPKSPGFGSVIAISPNGQMFASCDQEKNIVHLSSLDGVAIGELRHTAGVYSIDFSPDGQTLVTGDVSHEVHLWDVTRRERRATFRDHDAWIEMVRFSPDGKTIASTSDDGTIRLWRSEPPQ
jgi:WD40 repeat protein